MSQITPPDSAGQLLAVFENLSLGRPGQPALFTAMNWIWRSGEAWWVEGPPASGKTTFCESLLGRHLTQAGSRTWPLATSLGLEPREILRLVGWGESSRQFRLGDYFHQQRWHAAESREGPSLAEFTGPAALEALEALNLASRLAQPLVTLSSGQMRRARLAKALGEQPAGLIAEEPFAGLDSAQRGHLDALLRHRVAQGMGLVITGRPADRPGWISHILSLAGPETASSTVMAPVQVPKTLAGSPVLEYHGVTLAPGGRPLLHDFTWVVRQGERWGLTGENGSGKSTLMALAAGDHPLAYALDVRLFGARRGSGESIWELKKRIGQVAPEVQTYCRHALTLGQMVATGFTDRYTPGGIDTDQAARVRQLMDELGLVPVINQPYPQATTGAQRLVWLARALVKQPDLLLLDEPFQGMDPGSIALARAVISRHLLPQQTLVMTTHDPAELPAGVNRFLRLGEN